MNGVQNAFEPAIWNYDIESLRKLITLELNNENLKSIRVSTEKLSLIWLTSEKGLVVDETVAPEGKYIEKKVVPVFRMDEKERVIAYATIWYDNFPVREQYFKQLIYDFLIVGAILFAISLLDIVRRSAPLEVIETA